MLSLDKMLLGGRGINTDTNIRQTKQGQALNNERKREMARDLDSDQTGCEGIWSCKVWWVQRESSVKVAGGKEARERERTEDGLPRALACKEQVDGMILRRVSGFKEERITKKQRVALITVIAAHKKSPAG